MSAKNISIAKLSEDLGKNVEHIVDDSQFNRNNALQRYDREVLENLEKRDAEYSTILLNYQQYAGKILKANPRRQRWFFVISLMILVASFSFLVYILWIASSSDNPNIVSVIAAATETLVAFLVFPKVIAEYLFNTNESANIRDIVNTIREHDIKLSEDVRGMLQENNSSRNT